MAFIERQEALRPRGAVRLATFWGPCLAVLALLLRWRRFRERSRPQRLLLAGWATLASICAAAGHAASWQLRPLPTDRELEALGGRRFRRPSDGRLLEYWLSGQPGAKTVAVFCHRMDGKVGADYGRAKVEAMLRARGACLVSPSVPGWSASPPYDTDRPVQWLKHWTQDMLRLLEELGAEHVYVLGLSWGAQLCLNLAMACQEKGLLRGVGQIGGFYWDTKLVRYPEGPEGGGPVVKFVFGTPAVVKPLAYLLMRPFVPKMGDVSMLPEKEAARLREHFGEDLGLFGDGMVRGMSYFLHQTWHVGCLCASKEADHYVDLSKFDPAIPMHLNLGKEDKAVDEQQQVFLAQVAHAELKMYEGSHMGFPLDRIIENLMTARA